MKAPFYLLAAILLLAACGGGDESKKVTFFSTFAGEGELQGLTPQCDFDGRSDRRIDFYKGPDDATVPETIEIPQGCVYNLLFESFPFSCFRYELTPSDRRVAIVPGGVLSEGDFFECEIYTGSEYCSRCKEVDLCDCN